MNAHRHPQVLYPDQLGERVDHRINLYDALERHWAMPSARAGQATPRAVLRRLGHTVPIAIARAISGDGFYLISGAMVALDLVLAIALVRR